MQARDWLQSCLHLLRTSVPVSELGSLEPKVSMSPARLLAEPCGTPQPGAQLRSNRAVSGSWVVAWQSPSQSPGGVTPAHCWGRYLPAASKHGGGAWLAGASRLVRVAGGGGGGRRKFLNGVLFPHHTTSGQHSPAKAVASWLRSTGRLQQLQREILFPKGRGREQSGKLPGGVSVADPGAQAMLGAC